MMNFTQLSMLMYQLELLNTMSKCLFMCTNTSNSFAECADFCLVPSHLNVGINATKLYNAPYNCPDIYCKKPTIYEDFCLIEVDIKVDNNTTKCYCKRFYNDTRHNVTAKSCNCANKTSGIFMINPTYYDHLKVIWSSSLTLTTLILKDIYNLTSSIYKIIFEFTKVTLYPILKLIIIDIFEIMITLPFGCGNFVIMVLKLLYHLFEIIQAIAKYFKIITD